MCFLAVLCHVGYAGKIDAFEDISFFRRLVTNNIFSRDFNTTADLTSHRRHQLTLHEIRY